MIKLNYYTDQIDKALKDHDPEYYVSIQFHGTQNKSNHISCPPALIKVIKNWYHQNHNSQLWDK